MSLLDFLLNHWALSLVALSGLVLLIQSFLMDNGLEVQPVQATVLVNRENALLADIRTESERATGLIPGALCLTQDSLIAHCQQLEDPNHPIVVYCHTGTRSLEAVRRLRKAGFKEAYSLAGGVLSWQEAQLPLEKKTAKKTKKKDT